MAAVLYTVNRWFKSNLPYSICIAGLFGHTLFDMNTSTTVPLKPIFIAPPPRIEVEAPVEKNLDAIENEIDFYLNRLLEHYGLEDKSKKSAGNFKKTVRLTSSGGLGV